MTPLEEQVEKLARRWEKEADEGELLDEVAYALEGAADELRALLPLEVTDGEARTKPYRCADCDQPHGPFNNIGSGQSNKPEVTYRLVCDRCWGPKPAALTQKGDNE